MIVNLKLCQKKKLLRSSDIKLTRGKFFTKGKQLKSETDGEVI